MALPSPALFGDAANVSFRKRVYLLVFLSALHSVSGCRSRDHFFCDMDADYLPFVQQIEAPLESPYCPDGELALDGMAPPPSVRRPEELEKWLLSLDEAVEIALSNSQVIRDVGGLGVNAPAAAPTVFNPAIQEADPRSGIEAALSAFDGQFGVNLFHEQSDRAFNNLFAATNGSLTSRSDFRMGIDKTAATGTRFTLENVTLYNRIYNFNPAGFNLFSSVYDTVIRAGVRHPLLQGGGVEFNRIAGPNATPGNYGGVLIARINSDISLADFEAAVRDLIRDVERTYWQLYFAYRDFNALKEGRRLALESWELEKRRVEAGIRTLDQEAFAREQYYAAQVGVENALGGTQGGGGVYPVERQLRSLLGLPTSDGRLITPSDEPSVIDIQFDWHESLAYALTRRVELRRQQWQIERRELELVAARNFEKMRLDFIGQYQWRGFGDELFGEGFRPAGSAFESLFNGNLQDWRVGIELITPVGNRIGHAAVRHAELQLARDRAVYDEMERQIAHQLRAAYTELDRAYVVSRSNYNRRVATAIRLQAERRRNAEGQTDLDLVLDAQRQAVAAESNYYRSIVDYNLALMTVHYARGTLLDRRGIMLAEGAWSDEAHRSAAKLARRFWEKSNYCLTTPPAVSSGAYPQRTAEGEPIPAAPDEELMPLPQDQPPMQIPQDQQQAIPATPPPTPPPPIRLPYIE
jgi:outer membrane protein TolC